MVNNYDDCCRTSTLVACVVNYPVGREERMTEQILVNGLLLGGVYALAAAGFSLVWGVMNIINLSHGSLIMLGAYLTFWLWQILGVDPFLSIPVCVTVLFIFGYLLQRGVINFVVRAPVFMTLILTFGINLIIVNLALVAFTADVRSVTSAYGGVTFELGDVLIPSTYVVIFVVALLLTAGTSLLLLRTRLGQAIRAVRMDADAARLYGARTGSIYAVTFGLGAGLAGAAGALISMVDSITPLMGLSYTAKAFTVTVLGGMGSMLGAMVGGVCLGLIEAFAGTLLGAGYQDMMGYILLIVILIVKPTGLFGKEYY
jgi:branched-chain amino acid transport system permease protein